MAGETVLGQRPDDLRTDLQNISPVRPQGVYIAETFDFDPLGNHAQIIAEQVYDGIVFRRLLGIGENGLCGIGD